MASTIETGHAKNVANLDKLIQICTTFGTTYNPSKTTLTLASLSTLSADARIVLDKLIQKNTDFHTAENNRKIAFKGLKPLSTRIVNALKVTDASDETIEDAKGINRKIQGASLSKTTNPDTIDPNNPNLASKHISTSQQSYDNLIEHIAKLISLVISEPTYAPNDVGLTQTDLNTYITQLKTLNINYMKADAEAKDARLQRNALLYSKNTGLYDIAQDTKNYVKSLYGAISPQYKQVSKIQFTNKAK